MNGSAVRDQRARLFLRLAAGIAALQAATHLVLFLRSQPAPGSASWPLVQAMQAQMAGPVSYWDMYFGYGLRDALTAILIAILIGLASTFDAGGRTLARRLCGVLILALIAYATIVWAYFFRPPLVFYAAVLATLIPGWLALRERWAS